MRDHGEWRRPEAPPATMGDVHRDEHHEMHPVMRPDEHHDDHRADERRPDNVGHAEEQHPGPAHMDEHKVEPPHTEMHPAPPPVQHEPYRAAPLPLRRKKEEPKKK
jgi:hypothetical protein